MDPKLLTENGWKAMVQKFKLKDNGLQRALADYQKLDEDEHDDCLKGIALVNQFAANLKKAREVTALPAVLKYLTDLVNAVQSESREISKAKALAAKAEILEAKADALQAKAEALEAKAEAKAAQQEEMARGKSEEEADEEDEEETGDSYAKLTKALQSLKSSKLPYYFIVCKEKPYGLIVSKRDISKSSQHKKELAKIAGGSTSPPKGGQCRREGNKLIFEMEKPPQGLARILQKWIKDATSIGFKVMVGNESADDGEDLLLSGVNPELSLPRDPSQEQPASGSAKEPSLGTAPDLGRPAGGPLSLGGSVGRGGKNKPEDVQAVQTALNRRNKAGLPVDGQCSPKTIQAIEAFQKLLGQFRPDGLIQPGRGTARALASNAKLGPPPEPPKPIAPPKLGKATLAKAPVVWHSTRKILNTNIEELKKGVRAEYGPEDPELLKQIDESMVKLGGILGRLDTRLADSLSKANASANGAARKAELKNAKIILSDYIKYVKSEPLIAHMDSNPFGVQTNLKKVLMDSLTHMAQAIG